MTETSTQTTSSPMQEQSSQSAPSAVPAKKIAKPFFIFLGIIALLFIPIVVFGVTFYVPNQDKIADGVARLSVTPTPKKDILFGSGDSPVQQESTPTPAVTSTSSKLGIFILSSYSEGAKKIVQAAPPVLKVMDPHSSPEMLNAVKDYKQAKPDGVVVVRIFGREPAFKLQDDPVQSAETYFTQRLKQPLEIMQSSKQLYDYIEAPNEVENTPGWETVEEVAWNGKFWARLTELNYQAGFKTCIGSIPVGNPGGDPKLIQEKLKAFSPALDAALKTGSTICYHGYSIEYSTDVAIENWFSLRHRIFTHALSEINPKYNSTQFIISEGGIDKSGNPETDGWQKRGSEQQFVDWLRWYDSELQKDPQVIGVTLFQIGDSYWSSFDVEPMAEEITDLLGN